MMMINLLVIFIVSLILNIYLLIFIKIGLLGLTLRERLNYILENKMYLFNF